MSSFTDAEKCVLDALEELGERTWAPMLEELLAIPSITGSAAEADAQRWVAGHLERIGLDVDLWSCDLDELRADPEFPGQEAPRDEAWGLVGVTPGGQDETPRVVLQGHVDVVPTGDLAHWVNGDPFTPRVSEGVMYGRGACDMKAGVVANLVATEAVLRSGVTLPGRIAVHSVVSEEDGGLGAFATLRRGHTGDACVITEPTSGTVITANGGALTFQLRVSGLATHGSTRYEGVSAFDVFLPVYQALQDLERDRNAEVGSVMNEYPIAYPLMVGRIQAGDWSSSVPDRLVAEGRYGVRLGEDVNVARAMFEQRVAEASGADPWLRDHPVVVEWSGGQFASGAFPSGHPFLDVVRGAYADATGGPPPRERGAPYGSDLRLYNAGGIPSLHLGPGEVRYAHSPLEQVRLAELADVARALVLTLLRS
jgi:acetylornithine deacetylase